MKIYPQDFEERIDFGFIRNRLRNYCSFEYGCANVEQMSASDDYESVVRNLSLTNEMFHILTDASLSLPDGAKYDLSDSLKHIRIEGMFLEEDELHHLRQTLTIVCQQTTFLKNLPAERFPLLRTLPEQYSTNSASIVVKDIDALCKAGAEHIFFRPIAAEGHPAIGPRMFMVGLVGEVLTGFEKEHLPGAERDRGIFRFQCALAGHDDVQMIAIPGPGDLFLLRRTVFDAAHGEVQFLRQVRKVLIQTAVAHGFIVLSMLHCVTAFPLQPSEDQLQNTSGTEDPSPKKKNQKGKT